MYITKQQLIEMNACTGGLKRFIKQTGNTDEPVLISSLVGGYNTASDLLWLAGKILPKDKIVKFACGCALINIELIKPYTDKYDAIVEFLNNPCAANAAYAAAAAANAAYAANAARAAAGAYAAYAAAFAARAAAGAYAADAADAAYAAASRAEVDALTKINGLLSELFSA